MGYDCVEFCNFHNHTAKEVKALLDKYNLECISVHHYPLIIAEKGQCAVDYFKTIGAKYIASGKRDKAKLAGTSEWNNTVSLYTKVTELLKENGIQMMYHNHDFEFCKYKGKFLLDWICETIPGIQPEIDTCWVHYAGYNPTEYILKYSGKIKIVHLKDFICKNLGSGPVYGKIDKADASNRASREENGFEYRPIGYGVRDIHAIIDASGKAGAEVLIVERDESHERPPLEAAKMSRLYLKSLGL